MSTLTVGYIVGSISSRSINRALANALVRLETEGLNLVEISIADLPFYSPDFDETGFPASVRKFKEAIAAVEGVIFVTPEYSRSIPGVLKNALDWAARPYGQNSFIGKPTAVIGTSPGQLGTAVGQQHLKSILTHFASPQMGQPEGFIHARPGLFSDEGAVADASTAAFLRGYLEAFAQHILRDRAADAVSS